MALSIFVGIPDLAQILLECIKTARSNLYASGHTYSPQCSKISPLSDVDFTGGSSQLSHSLPCMGVMPWYCSLL